MAILEIHIICGGSIHILLQPPLPRIAMSAAMVDCCVLVIGIKVPIVYLLSNLHFSVDEKCWRHTSEFGISLCINFRL